jgi:hypothetical protein
MGPSFSSSPRILKDSMPNVRRDVSKLRFVRFQRPIHNAKSLSTLHFEQLPGNSHISQDNRFFGLADNPRSTPKVFTYLLRATLDPHFSGCNQEQSTFCTKSRPDATTKDRLQATIVNTSRGQVAGTPSRLTSMFANRDDSVRPEARKTKGPYWSTREPEDFPAHPKLCREFGRNLMKKIELVRICHQVSQSQNVERIGRPYIRTKSGVMAWIEERWPQVEDAIRSNQVHLPQSGMRVKADGQVGFQELSLSTDFGIEECSDIEEVPDA